MDIRFDLSDDIIGVIFQNKIKEDDLDQLHQTMRERIQKYGKVSIFIEDQYGNGISFKALIKDFAFEISNNTDIRKIAIITDEEWFRGLSEIKSLITQTNVQSFEKSDKIKALNWIMSNYGLKQFFLMQTYRY